MALTVVVEPHPLLDLGAFVTRFPRSLASIPTPEAITALAEPGAIAPIVPSETVKNAVRGLLRHGGFKPSGRSKPASEYLIGAVLEGRFPRINAGVDACNVVSLHSGPADLARRSRSRGRRAHGPDRARRGRATCSTRRAR